MSEGFSRHDRDPARLHDLDRRRLLAIGAGRRLLDHVAGVLCALRAPLADGRSLEACDVRRVEDASFRSVPALAALLLHLDRWNADHGIPARLVDAVPDAWPARVAHLMLEGRLEPGLACDRSGVDRVCEWPGEGHGRERTDALLGAGRASSVADAVRVANRLASKGLVACFLAWSEGPPPLPEPGGVRPQVLPVLHVTVDTTVDAVESVRQQGWEVHDVPGGVAFEARLATALESAWDAEREGPATVLMRVPAFLGQPAALQGTDVWPPRDVEGWLRGYHVDRLFMADGVLHPDIRALVASPDRQPDGAVAAEEALDG